MQRALVIGAAGFVGPYLCRRLVSDGFSVLATKLENEKETEGITFVNLNILDEKQIDALLLDYKPDVIFHLAAQSSVKLSWEKPQLTFTINVIGAINVLESVRKCSPKAKIIIIGSGEEYGRINPEQLPIKEETTTAANNFYATSKATQNSIGRIYHQAYGMNVISVRAFNHIGPGQSTAFVIPDFCNQAIEIEQGKRDNTIFVGNLSSARDFTDVRDVAKAYSLLALKGRAGETYNVGSGKSYVISDLLKLILANTKACINVEIDQKRFRPIDTPEVRADISKLVADTGYAPEHKIEDTIIDIMNYYRERK